MALVTTIGSSNCMSLDGNGGVNDNGNDNGDSNVDSKQCYRVLPQIVMTHRCQVDLQQHSLQSCINMLYLYITCLQAWTMA